VGRYIIATRNVRHDIGNGIKQNVRRRKSENEIRNRGRRNFKIIDECHLAVSSPARAYVNPADLASFLIVLLSYGIFVFILL
jgi:hypothetical protein